MWVQKVSGGGVRSLTYSPDGTTLYTVDSSGWITAWDTVSRAGRKVVSDQRLSGSFHRICVLADGKRLATDIGRTGLYDLATGRHVLSAGPRMDFVVTCILSDGRLYGYDPDNAVIGGWNLTTDEPEPTRLVPKSSSPIWGFDLSPDERRAVVGSWDGTAVLYEWSEGPELQVAFRLPGEGNTFGARFSPDGVTLALSHSGAVTSLVDLDTGRVRVDRVLCWANQSFAFNPVCPVLVALNSAKVLTLFSTDTGEPIRSLDFALGKYVQCVAFAPDGLTCAVGGSNKQFAVFDVDL